MTKTRGIEIVIEIIPIMSKKGSLHFVCHLEFYFLVEDQRMQRLNLYLHRESTSVSLLQSSLGDDKLTDLLLHPNRFIIIMQMKRVRIISCVLCCICMLMTCFV